MLQAKSCFNLDLGRLHQFGRASRRIAKFTFPGKTARRDVVVTETRARRQGAGGARRPEHRPGPPRLLLASLANCVSIGLVTQAAKRGVEFRDFEIDVEGDFDVRGSLGDASVRPGFSSIRYTVRIDSDAPAETLEEILRVAERTSPMFDNISDGVPVSSRLKVTTVA